MDNQNQNQQPPYQQPPYQQQPYQQQPYYQPNYAQGQPMKPDNYLVWAILSTIFCCLPLGIVSIVYAAKVDNLYNAGDFAGALDASSKAKNYALWSAVSIVIIVVLVLIVAAIAAIADNM